VSNARSAEMKLLIKNAVIKTINITMVRRGLRLRGCHQCLERALATASTLLFKLVISPTHICTTQSSPNTGVWCADARHLQRPGGLPARAVCWLIVLLGVGRSWVFGVFVCVCGEGGWILIMWQGGCNMISSQPPCHQRAPSVHLACLHLSPSTRLRLSPISLPATPPPPGAL
jgi:hypothetical protein